MTPEPAHMAALGGGVPVTGLASTVDALAVALLATGLISVMARRLETAIWLLVAQGVLLLGVFAYRINQTFDTLNPDRLQALRG